MGRSKLVTDLVAGLEEWRKMQPSHGVREADGQPKNYRTPGKWIEAAKD